MRTDLPNVEPEYINYVLSEYMRRMRYMSVCIVLFSGNEVQRNAHRAVARV